MNYISYEVQEELTNGETCLQLKTEIQIMSSVSKEPILINPKIKTKNNDILPLPTGKGENDS